MLEFLSLLVYKLVICCERFELFTSGRIQARNSTLDVIDTQIKDVVTDFDGNPFERDDEDDGDDLEQLKVIKNPLDHGNRTILRTFCIQKAIYEEILRLNEVNLQTPAMMQQL